MLSQNMKYIKQRQFIPEKFSHIDLEDANVAPLSRKLWPLCDLKFLGNCQDIAIIPPEIHQEGDCNYWETAPRIKSCEDCNFHKRNCERC